MQVEDIVKAVEAGTINGKKFRYAVSLFALNPSTVFY
jgi:hypothetical protein